MKQLIEKLQRVKDPRRPWGNIRHKLCDIIFIGLASVICGGKDFVHMEDTGKLKEEWFRQYLELPNGIPDSDTFRRTFERLNPKHFEDALCKIVDVRDRNVAIDGKTIRGSGNAEYKAYHVLSAWVSDLQLSIGQMAVEEKTNEITAIPELIALFDIAGAIVTIDAMGCQKKIAEAIAAKEADYALALKGNQSTLLEDVSLYFETEDASEKKSTTEKDHGRIETRDYFLTTDIDWLAQRKDWPNLKAIGMVRSQVSFMNNKEPYTDCRYYLLSFADIDTFARVVRSHWGIENQLHWHLDVNFGEDASRARKGNSPLNLNILRKEALFRLKTVDLGKRVSIRRKINQASMSNNVLAKVLGSR